MPYLDKVDWHQHGDPNDLETEPGATHIGIFLAWAILGDLGNPDYVKDLGRIAADLRDRSVSPGTFLLDFFDGKFRDSDLNEEGSAFANLYYPESYFADYNAEFGVEHPTLYDVPDRWESFDRIRLTLDSRLAAWREKTPRERNRARARAGPSTLDEESRGGIRSTRAIADYPPFGAPMFALDRTQWSREEAREHVAWIESHVIERSDSCLAFLHFAFEGMILKDLKRLQATICDTIVARGWIEPDLTLDGNAAALALDVGMILSRKLLERFPTALRWAIGKGFNGHANEAVLVDTATGGESIEVNPISWCHRIISTLVTEPDVAPKLDIVGLYKHVSGRIQSL